MIPCTLQQFDVLQKPCQLLIKGLQVKCNTMLCIRLMTSDHCITLPLHMPLSAEIHAPPFVVAFFVVGLHAAYTPACTCMRAPSSVLRHPHSVLAASPLRGIPTLCLRDPHSVLEASPLCIQASPPCFGHPHSVLEAPPLCIEGISILLQAAGTDAA